VRAEGSSPESVVKSLEGKPETPTFEKMMEIEKVGADGGRGESAL
jgi:hypothetical protein